MVPTLPSLRRQTALCVLLLAALAAALLGWYVEHGGFYWDDWQNAATSAIGHPGGGFLGPLDVRQAAYEPGLALLIPAAQSFLGPDPDLHLALGASLAVAASACFFVVLRMLGLRAVHAAAIAALALVFPWSDSNRLWAAGGLNNVAVCLFLAGLATALHELRAENRRLRAISLGLYAASVLTYDIAGLATLMAGAVYPAAAPRARARTRWRTDLLVVAPAVAVATLASTKHKYGPGESLAHGWLIAKQAMSLIGRAAVPVGAPSALAAVIAMSGLCVAAVAVRRALPQGSDARSSLGRWLRVAGGAAAGVVAAYAMFAAADPKYLPLADGLYNRVNTLAGFMIAALVYALAALVANIACAAPRLRRAATPVLLAAAAAVGAGWAARVHQDERTWVRAAGLQSRVLGALGRAAPHAPRRGLFFYTFGIPLRLTRGVPVFVSWDLNAAAKVVLRDATVGAAPVAPGFGVRCDPQRARVVAPGGYLRAPARYGRLVFLDVPTRRAFPIPDRKACSAVASSLR